MHNHSNNTPSFSIVIKPNGKEAFKCHGNCGREGDAVDLVGYLRIPGYNDKDPKDIERALEFLESRYQFDIPDPKTYDRAPDLIGDEWKQFFPPQEQALKYLTGRGLSLSTITHFKLGQDGRLVTIPAFEEDKLMGIKYRNMGSGLRYWSMNGSKISLFNYDEVAYSNEPIIIAKGEFAAMMLWQYGFKVCAPSQGERANRERWKIALALSPKRIAIGDNDDTGRTAVIKRAEMFSAEIRFPPPQFKDVDEWLLKDKTASQTMRTWLA
jgi:DNA primase